MAIPTAELVVEIRRLNPGMSAYKIAHICSTSEKFVRAALNETARGSSMASYAGEVNYVRKVILERGRIYEGCRQAFEEGLYRDENLERMLKDGVIVPSVDPNGGYVLPE